jgi:hypothetical protein
LFESEGDLPVKINSLTTTTLSFFALLGLTVISPACNKGDDGDAEEVGDGDGDTDTTGDSESGESTGDTTTEDTTTEDTTTTESTTETTETTGGDLPNGSSCTSDGECLSGNCYVVPFLGGQCGECNEDADCPAGGCTPPNPFEANGSVCNMGELGGGCETTDVCMEGLVCGNVLDLLGLIQINTCGNCEDDAACSDGQICAPVVSVMDFSGINDCIDPNSLPQDSFCNLMGNGNEACESGICSTIDIMGLAQVGACGACNEDADCMGGQTCTAGEFVLDSGTLVGSTCQ